jgi:bacterioferritin
MKGNPEIIDALNDLLADELTAICQYIVQAEQLDVWGYEVLHTLIENEAKDEMKHAAMHIRRITFLEGEPDIKLRDIEIGSTVREMLEHNLDKEYGASDKYNKYIKLSRELEDEFTRDYLEQILKDETHHIDFIESHLEQIDQMGIQNYLSLITK